MNEANVTVMPSTHTADLMKISDIRDCPTSLDLTTQRGRALAFAAGNPADLDFDKGGQMIIEAVDFLAFPDSRVDEETGEVQEFARVVLFDKYGQFFRTSSDYAWKRIRTACSLFTPDEWKAGIRFRITKRIGKRGRTYHDIRVMHDEEPVT